MLLTVPIKTALSFNQQMLYVQPYLNIIFNMNTHIVSSYFMLVLSYLPRLYGLGGGLLFIVNEVITYFYIQTASQA
jgi:hypothetical protein